MTGCSMKRVEANGDWSLFCPNEAPGMADVHSAEFEALYEKYEKEGRQRRTVPAQKLWYAILEAQIETGGPFMVYKDAANGMSSTFSILCCTDDYPSAKSNQQNVGTIKSSNLCTEIIEYSSPDETAVCNLPRSLSLPSSPMANTTSRSSTWSPSPSHTTTITSSMSTTYCPIPEVRQSNFRINIPSRLPRHPTD